MTQRYYSNYISKPCASSPILNKKMVEPWGFVLSYEIVELQLSTLLVLVFGYVLYL